MVPPIPVAPPPPPEVSAWRTYYGAAGTSGIRAGLAALLAVFIAWSLGPFEYGLLSSGIAFAAVLAALTGFGLDRAIENETREHPDQGPVILGTAMGLRLGVAAVAYAGLLLLLPRGTPARTVWLVAGLSAIAQVPLAVECWLRARKEPRYGTIARNTGYCVTFAACLLFALNGASAVWFAAVLAFEAPVAALILFNAHARIAPTEDAFDWNLALAKKWLRAGARPLGVALLAVLFAELNLLLLVWIRGPMEAGYYAAALRLVEAVLFVFLFVATVKAARIRATRSISEPMDAAALVPVFNLMAKQGWIAAVILAGAGPWILRGLFGIEYLGAGWTLSVLGLALLPAGMFGCTRIFPVSLPREKPVVVGHAIGLGLNLLLACVLLPRWGALGASISTVLCLTLVHLVVPRFFVETRSMALAQIKAIRRGGRTDTPEFAASKAVAVSSVSSSPFAKVPMAPGASRPPMEPIKPAAETAPPAPPAPTIGGLPIKGL